MRPKPSPPDAPRPRAAAAANTPVAGEAGVREVEAPDRERLVEITGRCGNLTPDEKDCATELIDIYLGEPHQEDYLFLTATDARGVPAGYICYGKASLAIRAYDIYWIVVDPDSRRRGVATRLLKFTEELLFREGARLILAETSGLPGYAPARAFYESNGYREEARIAGYYRPGDDLVIYVKRA